MNKYGRGDAPVTMATVRAINGYIVKRVAADLQRVKDEARSTSV